MSESDLYEAAFGFAVLGGLFMGLLGLVYQLWARFRGGDVVPSHEARSAFNDARIIAGLSLVPQCSILTLPVIYPSPRDVPTMLGPAAIFVAAMLLCSWVWQIVKMWKARARVRAWFSPGSLAAFTAPFLSVCVFVAAFFLRGHK